MLRASAADVAVTSREAIRRAEARVGTVLRGKYRIDRVLGAGGMAVVYEVTHRNQKRFALKMLHVALSTDEDIRRRFLREGYAANTVGHPGAVVVIDDETAEDGAAFLVMELLDGRQLDELLVESDRRLPPQAVLAAAEQTLDVLVPAHAKGIIHRDIKPANLFVLRDGTLKVLDFGIARLHDLAGSSQATHTGVMLGTPAYMGPEQALSQASQIDAQTDLWSVGATMFTLLSGANVHPGQTATQILVAAATQNARAVTSIAPWVDERISDLVAKAVAFKKSDRWSSAAEMRDAVRKVHEEVFGVPPSRGSLASLIGPGEWEPSNPQPFILSESPPDPAAQAAITVPGGTGKVVDESARGVDAAGASQQSSVASSTAKPVSSVSTPPQRSDIGLRGGTPWIAAAIGLLCAGALLFALKGSRSSTASVNGAASEAVSAPGAQVTPPATPSAPISASSITTPSTTPTATPTATTTPTTTSTTTSTAATSPTRAPSANKRPQASPPAPVQAAPASAQPSSPPIVVDAGDLVLQRK